ncbi:MAG: GNAT family N-acetyltransferase, partial [Verrucomicrobiales bacterium]
MEVERITTQLANGHRVELRPLSPSDRGALAEGYRRLSPESRYQRFWVRGGEVMGEGMLDRILEVDPWNHAVWALLDRTREFPGVGAASFWRSSREPEEAEFSCTVLDSDQGCGVGTLLLATVWCAAYRVGVRRFVG